jgi:tetrapyrrole methylase family protein/MazG family protein
MKDKYTFEDFVDIMKRLRSENGCPWDKVQTHESLRQCMIEEAYEAVEAINNNDMDNLCEELGDVLMQVVFHAQIEAEKGGFTIDDVIDGISKKMISRHSHIFGTDKAETPEDVIETWEKNKKKEKGFESYTDMMKSVPKALPALTKARKIQNKAKDAGIDIKDINEAFDKIREEINELETEIKSNGSKTEEEFGDVLFSAVNISRFLGINPEFSLTNSSEKFINRFEYIEKYAHDAGKDISSLSAQELDMLWESAKNFSKFKED